MNKGIFITFEGIDGSGKSTQIEMLKKYLLDKGYDPLITREPGGNQVSERIRDIILDKDLNMMSPVTETLLYAAARAQIVFEVIKPSIDNGRIVICDRFLDSSIAYQGYGRGLEDMVSIINEYAIDGLIPDKTFLLQIPPQKGKNRITGELDRLEMESLIYFDLVYNGYEEIAKSNPDRVVRLNAEESVEQIHNQIVNEIERLFA